jgi:hypothetical protein
MVEMALAMAFLFILRLWSRQCCIFSVLLVLMEAKMHPFVFSTITTYIIFKQHIYRSGAL